MRWLLFARRWVQNPPSAKQVRFVLIIVLICFILYGIEHYVGWPEWLEVNRIRRH